MKFKVKNYFRNEQHGICHCRLGCCEAALISYLDILDSNVHQLFTVLFGNDILVDITLTFNCPTNLHLDGKMIIFSLRCAEKHITNASNPAHISKESSGFSLKCRKIDNSEET